MVHSHKTSRGRVMGSSLKFQMEPLSSSMRVLSFVLHPL
ncbi:hypothetical protein LINPERHAP2_LOCUS7081 [Linum perenne]